jgi:PGF-pre-PGF domain-containing protein
MMINKSNLSVTSIRFTINKNESLMTLVVTKVGDLPKAIENLDETYEMIDLNPINFKSGDLSDLKVGFRVAKEWFEEKVLAIGDIVVMSLDGEEWDETVATNTGEDDSYYYFMSEPSGLDFITVGARRPILLTSLKPTEEELRKISLDGLEDPLIKRKLQEYYEFAVDFEASKLATSDLADKLTLSKELKILDDGHTRIDIVVKSLGGSVNDIIMVEPIPKIILENVAEIVEPTPKYDIIIKEDPIIQWRFKEVDTAIVAWHIKRIEGNGEVLISYKVDGEFGSDDHVSAMLIKILQKTDSPTGRVVQDKADIGEIDSKNNWKLYGLFFFTLIVFVSVIVYIFRTQKKEPTEKEEQKIEKETRFPEQKPNVNTVAAAVKIKKPNKHKQTGDDPDKDIDKDSAGQAAEKASEDKEKTKETMPQESQERSEDEKTEQDTASAKTEGKDEAREDIKAEIAAQAATGTDMQPGEQIRKIRDKLKNRKEKAKEQTFATPAKDNQPEDDSYGPDSETDPKIIVLPLEDEGEEGIDKTNRKAKDAEEKQKDTERENRKSAQPIQQPIAKKPGKAERQEKPNEKPTNEQAEILEKYYKMVFEDYTPVEDVLEFKKEHNLTDKIIKEYLKSKKKD